MAIVKGKKKDVEVVEEVKTKKAKKSAPVEVVEEEIVEEEVLESTNPEDFTYTVKLEAKKITGRTSKQVDTLVFGAMGAMKKITIEKE